MNWLTETEQHPEYQSLQKEQYEAKQHTQKPEWGAIVL